MRPRQPCGGLRVAFLTGDKATSTDRNVCATVSASLSAEPMVAQTFLSVPFLVGSLVAWYYCSPPIPTKFFNSFGPSSVKKLSG
jgi:hypothetical protein